MHEARLISAQSHHATTHRWRLPIEKHRFTHLTPVPPDDGTMCVVFTDGGWSENFRSQLACLELEPGMEVAPRRADSFHRNFPVAVVGKFFMPENLSANKAINIRSKVLSFTESSFTKALATNTTGSSSRSKAPNLHSTEVNRRCELSVMTLAQEQTWGMSEYSIEGYNEIPGPNNCTVHLRNQLNHRAYLHS